MKEGQTYEIGYLLTPLIPAEQVEESVEELYKTAIEALGGEVIYRVTPKMRQLAYEVSSSINNKKSTFRDAYFGAVKFQLTADQAAEAKRAFEKDSRIIRFLLVVAPKVDERAVKRMYTPRRPELSSTPVVEGEKGNEMTKEEIDREIDGLLETAEA